MNVVIAGAGPVGLSAACALAHAGAEVAVLEAEPALPETLRASTFQPPTLDLLERFGAAARLIEMGRKAPKLQYRDRAGWVAEMDFGLLAGDTRHPFRVQCEQFRLNRVLAERLSGRIRYSCEVAGVEQDDAGVSVTLKSGERVQGDWLIGADGARSAVRKALGIAFDGFTWPERFLVASTPFDFSAVFPGLADVSYFADPEEWFFLLKVRDLWRVMFPTRAEEKDEEILSDAAIQARLRRIHGGSASCELSHRTLYPVHQRVAAAYRRGRAFLAGDAAHLNNPLGGMGMNGGIHDAFNLADKLLRGGAALDDYERQRRPVALEYVNTVSIANKRNLETRDAAEQRRWREELSRVAASPALQREYLLKISMISSLRRSECA